MNIVATELVLFNPTVCKCMIKELTNMQSPVEWSTILLENDGRLKDLELRCHIFKQMFQLDIFNYLFLVKDKWTSNPTVHNPNPEIHMGTISLNLPSHMRAFCSPGSNVM